MPQREKVIHSYLIVMTELAEARVAALFEPRAHRQELVAQVRLDQAAIDAVELAWRTQRPSLEASGVVRFGAAVVLQLGGRKNTAGLLYLDRVQEGFPTAAQRRIQEAVVELLTQTEPSALGPALAQHDRDEGLREQMTLVLGRCNGNVAAAARLLGVSRQTLYDRAERLSIDVGAFRLR